MRLLLSWARDFVDVQASPEEISEDLTLRGFEVSAIEPTGADDAVIEFDLKSNRPDCLSVTGLAREIATTYDLPLRQPSPPGGARAAKTTPASDQIKVFIEDDELCPRYAAAIAEVMPDTVSPAWMVERLKAAGIRPISPFVDVTNYVLVELGHPLHAFDLSTLSGHTLRIRRAAAGEKITTLDGVQRTLDADMLVIADAEHAQAVAGVMGGARSEVSAKTRMVVFESAYFKPASVRRTSKRLGIQTEASKRFERGADINAPVVALERALSLMQEIGAGRQVGPIVDVYPKSRGPQTVRLRQARLWQLLGLEVPDKDVERILTSLGLGVAATPEGWSVAAPTFRVDITREVDLIEEVGRHYGLDKLQAEFPPLTSAAPAGDPRVARDQLVRRVLTGAGLNEAITFGFIEAAAARAFVVDSEVTGLVDIANPLSAKFATLRPSLVPGLVDVVAYNRRHGRRDVAVFEIGARFHAATGETRGVAIALTGARAPEHWSGSARDADFFDVKGIIEHLCGTLGVAVRFAPTARPFLVAGQTADILATDGTPIGIAGLVQPALVEARGAVRQDRIYVAEVNLDHVARLSAAAAVTEQVQALPRFPFVVRDVSIVVPDALPAEIIRDTIHAFGARGQAPLVDVSFFDRYAGKELGDGKVSLSVRLTFQSPTRTLTDVEVQQSVDIIVAALAGEHGARQR